jgi:hypothetical protein
MRLVQRHPDEAARETSDEEPPHFAVLGARAGRYAGRVTVRTTGVRQPGPVRRFQDWGRPSTAPSDGPRPNQDPPLSGPPQASVEERHGMVIVTPLGTLRDPLPVRLVEMLEASACRPVIVDLSQITLVSAAPVMGVAGWVIGASHQPDQCCVVCPRATARALLRKWHVTRCLAIFGSVGDALQARRFGDEGYGAGWHPATSAASDLRFGCPTG